MKYPKELAPTIIKGMIFGKYIRYESLDGDEEYAPIRGGVIELNDCKPIERNGKIWFIPHQQYRSYKGYLKTSPDCYHRWWFWKLQETFIDPITTVERRKPGTERGIYFRKPFSWRFDRQGTISEGILKHWIWTKGFLGCRWD